MIVRFSLATLSTLGLLACAVEPTELRTTTQGLSAVDALSFDDASDWSASQGSHASSSILTEGSASVEVDTTYYTELSAGGLETPPSVGSDFSFDLRLDQQLGWGEVKVVLDSPTASLWSETIGTIPLSGLAPGQFHHIELPLSPQVQSALQQSYSDLTVRFIFNAPPATFWLDGGSFGSSGPSCSDGIQNGDETGVDCGGSCEPCASCGDGACDASESCSSCSSDCGPCGASHCSDGELSGNETEVDCGGACAPCGAATAGLLYWDKFTNGLGDWTASGFSEAPLAHTEDYAESGSGSPAATAATGMGQTTLTSPSIDLSAAVGDPLLRFHRLLDSPAGTVTSLQVSTGGSWQTVRDLASDEANDNRWRTEFVSLENYATATNFRVRFVTSGQETTFQVDDVSISDRSAVDLTENDQTFVMDPGAISDNQQWEWRIDQADPWSGPRRGPFEGDDGSWPKPDSEADTADIWLRTTFDIQSSEDLAALRFWTQWDDQLEIRVNGTLVVDEDSWSPSYQFLEPAASAFVVGTNTIEVHAHDFGGGRYVDVGLSREVSPASVPETVSPAEYASGGSDPLAGFADRIHEYILTRRVPGLGFALYKDEARVVEGAWGHRDRAQSEPMPLNPVMRLASVDKSYTVIAAWELIDSEFQLEGGETLKENTLVFPTLRDHYGFDAVASEAGPDADKVTVGQLMNHMAHVKNFAEGGDSTFYNTVGSSPGHTTRHDNALFIHQAGCFREPGTGDEQYNNGGYMLLRYFIDEITDGGLLDYINTNLASDVFITHEALLGRNSREPWYATQDEPYDRWINFEHYTGLAASPRSAAELGMTHHLIDGDAAPNGGITEGCEVRNGGMNGTSAFAAQCERGITFALLFNGHQQGGSYYDLVNIVRDYALSLPDSAYQ